MNDIKNINNFCELNFKYICLISICITILTCLVIYIKGIDYVNVFYLIIFLGVLFFVFNKISDENIEKQEEEKEKKEKSFSKLTIFTIGVIFFDYILVFSLIGFPKIKFFNSIFSNLLIYIICNYILLLFFKIKNNRQGIKISFNIFKVLLIICLILPFINFIFY